ncbi:hypothetical protein N9O88_00810, partial [bacterium]|nr:hypothetical protein [bacterium]
YYNLLNNYKQVYYMPNKTQRCKYKKNGVSGCRKCCNKSKKCIKKCMSYPITYKGGSFSQKVCPLGKILNPKTNRCNKLPSATRSTSPVTRTRTRRPSPVTRTRTRPPSPIARHPSPKQIDPNYIGKKNKVNYLADKLSDNDFRENTSIPIDDIISRLSPDEEKKWNNMNLRESDIVWVNVDEKIMHCGRAVFLVHKKRNKLYLMIFPMCCQNINKLKDENGKVNRGTDKDERYDFTEGDCFDNGYMIHPKSYKIIKVF